MKKSLLNNGCINRSCEFDKKLDEFLEIGVEYTRKNIRKKSKGNIKTVLFNLSKYRDIYCFINAI